MSCKKVSLTFLVPCSSARLFIHWVPPLHTSMFYPEGFSLSHTTMSRKMLQFSSLALLFCFCVWWKERIKDFGMMMEIFILRLKSSSHFYMKLIKALEYIYESVKVSKSSPKRKIFPFSIFLSKILCFCAWISITPYTQQLRQHISSFHMERAASSIIKKYEAKGGKK